MKKYFNLKKIISLLLALLMGLSTAAPAFAADGNYTIKIKPDTYTDTTNGSRFEAYQVFTGVLTEGKENSRQLADIKWGKGVDGEALIEELILISAGDDDVFSQKFKALSDPGAAGYEAEVIANILSENANNADFVHSFAKLAQKHKTTASAVSSFEDGNFVITVTDPGYYLVVDTTENPKDMDVVSAYILDVLGDQSINMKAEAPTVDKKIVSSSDDKTGVNGKSFEIGDEVIFRLIGKIPDYFKSYDPYSYKFVDTMSEALTYVPGSVVVTLRNTENEIISTVNSDSDLYTVENTEENPQQLTIAIADLNKIDKIDKNLEIVVEYKAKLNEKAKISAPNPNDVYLEFSHNPYADGTGQTPEVEVNTFTFGLDITKQNQNGEKLDGVGFMLYKKVANDIYFANGFTEQSEGEDTIYKLNSENWAKADVGQELFTANGGKLYIDGLSEGTYYLKETTKPNGYTTMKDIEITIDPVIDENGVLTDVNITIGDRPYNDASVGDLLDSGRTQLTLVNSPAAFLPNTGGIGTVIFYVLGGAILAGAVICLVVSKKSKKLKNQEQ